MTPEQLAAFARQQLDAILEMSGAIMYSGASTLQRGEVYLLGLNPGGSPNDPVLSKITVGSSLAGLPTSKVNSYLDETWVGPGLLQRRIKWLLSELGLDPRAVAASNLSFVRSPNQKTAQISRFADLCWPVHEQILSIVRPRLVLTYGHGAYRYLKGRFAAHDETRYPSGHGTWECRAFSVPRRFAVASTPHMSYYAIDTHPDVVTWLRALQSATL